MKIKWSENYACREVSNKKLIAIVKRMRSNLDHLNKKFDVYGFKIKDRFNDKVHVETIYWKFYESLRHFSNPNNYTT